MRFLVVHNGRVGVDAPVPFRKLKRVYHGLHLLPPNLLVGVKDRYFGHCVGVEEGLDYGKEDGKYLGTINNDTFPKTLGVVGFVDFHQVYQGFYGSFVDHLGIGEALEVKDDGEFPNGDLSGGGIGVGVDHVEGFPKNF